MVWIIDRGREATYLLAAFFEVCGDRLTRVRNDIVERRRRA